MARIKQSQTRFQKLHNDLAQLINNAQPGDKLKSEPELAESLGVSRATLREAMRSFENQGLIRRRQGVGTFITSRNQNIETGLEKLESIETQAKRLGMEVRMGHLISEEAIADEKTAENLKIKAGDIFIRVSRTIWMQDRPIAYLVDELIDGILTKEELSEKFSGSVLDILIKKKEHST